METAANRRVSALSPFASPFASSFRPLLALGAELARRGVLAKIAVAVAALTTIAASIVAVVLGRRGGTAPIHLIPAVAASALAWGAGFLLAFGSAAHALRRDREDGIQHLLVARTASLRAYVAARVLGLALVLAGVVGGGTLVTGVIAAASTRSFAAALRTAHTTVASLVFALAFALVLAPIALAALGARSRAGGYLFMLAVVVLPEVVAGILAQVLPSSVVELVAVPSALVALRTSLSPGATDLARAAEALVALGLWSVVGSALVHRATRLLDGGPFQGGRRGRT